MPQIVVLVVGILVFFFIYKLGKIVGLVRSLLLMLTPILIGLGLAYLLNPLMMIFEKHVGEFLTMRMKKKEKIPALARGIGIAASLAVLIFMLYFLFNLVIPQIYNNVRKLIVTLPGQINQLMARLEKMTKEDQELSEIINTIYTEAMKFLTNWVKRDMFSQVTVLLNGMVGFLKTITDVLVGLIVAVYVLASKETFKRQSKKLLYAFFNDTTSERLIEIARESDKIFGGFIVGKIVDSIIIGILCFIGMVILRLPYAVLIAVMVGVTNVVPFFGPYIGAIPSSILIFLTSPTKGLIFLLFILALQQFDGNILGPKILGESTGLSPFWVIFAILVGGGLFGVVGMVLGVPTMGVIYYLMKRLINYKLISKGKEEEI